IVRPDDRGLYKYRLDLAPTLVITAAVGLGVAALWLDHGWLWLIVPLSFAGRLPAPAHQHAQGHLSIFRSDVANAIYDQILALASGHTTAVWEQQHSLGHHLQYLDSRVDVAGADRFAIARGRSRLVRRIVFVVCADALTVPDAFAIAAQFPAKRRRLRTRLIVQTLSQLAVLAGLFVIDPIATVAVFIVPNIVLRWLVGWIAFAQHDGVPATITYDGSMNEFGFVSRLLLNVGHHTAHHEKPTLHWSLLPARTAKILHLIPSSCVRGTPDAGWGSSF
ncbi:MAG: Fatty acid desaturase family protein, partial [Myxococcales bacterium]|nr:Fatty acid desaturase family protein [Myxococcales bacterium]